MVCPVPPLAIGRLPVTSVARLTVPVVKADPDDRTTPEVGTTATVPDVGRVRVVAAEVVRLILLFPQVNVPLFDTPDPPLEGASWASEYMAPAPSFTRT